MRTFAHPVLPLDAHEQHMQAVFIELIIKTQSPLAQASPETVARATLELPILSSTEVLGVYTQPAALFIFYFLKCHVWRNV